MTQQQRDVLHLIVDKLPTSSESEGEALHDLVNEAFDAPAPPTAVEAQPETPPVVYPTQPTPLLAAVPQDVAPPAPTSI